MPGERGPASIAVVGMACWYPGARSPRELWENILARRQEFRAFLEERMPARDYHDPDPTAPDRTYGTQGAFIDGFRFDPLAWRVPRSTFQSTDISHWLALEVAARALADAGHAQGEGLPRERTGVLVGNSLTGEQTRANSMRLRWPFVRRLVAAEARKHLPAERVEPMVEAIGERYRSHFPPTNEDTLAGALSNTIAGRICGFFDLGGGGYVVDGACASSMLAVCTAASALEEGRLDAAIAGGIDISMDPFELVGFAKARALTPTAMHVYDRRGSGFIPGEGCGFVVLKRLEDARAAGDRVYAILQGWGVSSDGRNAITAPKVAGQARAIRAAWARAGRPDFVEGHGTGTAVGDKVELEAIAQAAGEEGGRRAVGVTSLKSILGHTKAAAGIGAFLKAVIAANRRVLPPTAACAEPNGVFDGPARALYPLRRGAARDPRSTLKAGASAMGFGGINAHTVVLSGDEPDPRLAPTLPEASLLASAQDSEIFVFGAESLADLRAQLAELRPVAARVSLGELADLSEALIARLPAQPPVRAAILASTPAELVARLDRLLVAESADGPQIWLGRPSGAARLGFLCPGQGSQELESAAVLLARDPALAATASELAAVAEAEGCPGLLDLLYPALDQAVTAEEAAAWRARLSRTEVAQPALCLVSLIWARRLAELGLEPTVVAGHSLGELTAFALAGAIDAATLIRLAVRRGAAMAGPPERPGGMLSLATDAATAESLVASVEGYAAIANFNAPHQVVVAGERQALEQLSALAGRRRIPARALPVSNGFHSELVAGAAARLAAEAPVPERPAPPRAILLSSMREAPVDEGCDLRAHVSEHVRRPVDFVGLLRRVVEHADLLIEVGSGRVLSGLADRVLEERGPRCLPVEGSAGRAADLQAVLASAWTRGVAVRWSALHRGRLVRPFVAPGARVFIANPCEVGREPEEPEATTLPARAAPALAAPAAPALPSPVGGGHEQAILARLLDRVSEKTGFDRSSLSGDQRLRDDLNLDSIKAGEVVAAAARELGVADRVDPAQLAPASLGEIARALAGVPRPAEQTPPPPPTRTPATSPPADLLPWLLARVAETTGFEPGSLSADQRLQDDLNLDSIKAGEIVGAAARQAGVADRVDPAQYLRQPIGAIARSLAELGGDVAAIAPAEAERPTPIASPPPPPAPLPPEAARWARTFGLSVAPDTSRARADWTGGRVSLLAAEPLRAALDARLVDAGARVEPGGAELVVVLGATDTVARVRELRALVDALGPATRGLLVVQRLDGRFGLVSPGSGTAGAAFARSLSLERPQLAVSLLDVAAELPEQALLDAIVEARPERPGFVGRGVDAEGRWRLDARPLAPARFPARPDGLRRGELVLVTGGARGITAACAEALARQTGARLALVGSTPRERVDQEVIQVLGRLTLAGVEARYWPCDLGRPEAVAALVAAVRAEQGPIAAVVHGAGRNTPRRVEQVSTEDALAEIAPKLLGGEALLAALEDAPPRLFVALTSIIGVSGMQGNAWYAFANEALDLALAGFAARHPQTAAVSVAYGVWGEIGMGAKLGSVPVLAKMGIGALDPAEGVARFLSVVTRDPGVRQPVVTAHVDGLPTWPARAAEDPDLRFLDGERAGVPGVEARVTLTLHPERDPWLLDHDYKGSLLFPTVFGLEAMAEAAWAARGGGDAEVVGFEEILLPAPIVVAPGGARVQIRALVREDEPEVVDCEIRTEQSSFARPHFLATVRFARLAAGEPQALPALAPPAPPLDPVQDLYGGLLFQGPAFQRLTRVVGGEGPSLRFAAAVAAPARGRWLAGDPFFRDALLQSGQLVVAQDDALPVRIARIGLAAGHAEPGEREGVVTLLATRDRRHHSDLVMVDGSGRRLQWLQGYEVQVLARHPERPELDGILRPRGEALGRLRARIAEIAALHGLPAPRLATLAEPLQERPVEERRAAARALLAALDPSAEPRWAEDGRPSLVDGRGLSIAHDERACLLVVAEGAVGCDLEPVRPRADWPALLGPARARLLGPLRADGADAAGTRIWTAGEALYKAGGGHATPEIVRREGELVELRSGEFRIFTFPFALERGPARMVALAFGPAAPVAAAPPPLPAAPPPPSIDPGLLSVRIREGSPSWMETRYVVTFDEASSISGRVPTFTLAAWMGRLRELAITGLSAPIQRALGGGRDGMVTQSGWVRLTGEAAALDRIEARTWAEELRPSTCLLRFSFERVGEDGARTPLGEAAQRFGWVEVLGHGQVRAAPFPSFLHDYLASMQVPDQSTPPAALLLPATPPLITVSVPTSQVDSNAVGNLYYANYFKWAQRAVDQLVWRHAPESLRGRGQQGELALRGIRLEFLREAMPFETLEVSLHAAESAGQEIAFDLLFQRPEPDGSRTRLALGRLEGRWTAPDGAPLPPPPWTSSPPPQENAR